MVRPNRNVGFEKFVAYISSYHWALLTGPKTEGRDARGNRFHVKEKLTNVGGHLQRIWKYEKRTIGTAATAMILVRITVAKVKDRDRLKSIFNRVPVRSDNPEWNCVEWVKEALANLQADGRALGTSCLDWETIRDTAMWYVQSKEADHRFDGQALPGQFDTEQVPTWDLLVQVETMT